MQTSTLILLFGLVACTLAARGGGGHGGGFGRGGHFGGGGADKFPQSCKTDADNAKQCFADNVKAKGVNINIDDVKACFESCQRPERPEGDAKGGNHTKGNWGGRHGKGGDRNGTGAHGNFSQMQEQMKAYGECMKNKLGDKQEQCVKGKISYAVAAQDEQPHAKGGRGMGGGFGNPLTSLSKKVEKCGAATETCVKAAMGEWYDKTDELSKILCDASTACPQTTSDQCKADRKAARQAECECREQLSAETAQAKTDCATTDELKQFVDRMGSHGKGDSKQPRSCDEQANSNHDDKPQRQRPSPFCPQPEGSKQRFAKRG